MLQKIIVKREASFSESSYGFMEFSVEFYSGEYCRMKILGKFQCIKLCFFRVWLFLGKED